MDTIPIKDLPDHPEFIGKPIEVYGSGIQKPLSRFSVQGETLFIYVKDDNDQEICIGSANAGNNNSAVIATDHNLHIPGANYATYILYLKG